MDRIILHADCNSYFASVECIARPELRSVPMAVCGDPEDRHGIILAKNEPAKKFGISTAETVWKAKRKCPDLVLISPHHDRYALYCEKINHIYAQYTDRVERFSIDESYLDVTGSTGLFGSGRSIADTLRQRVREELGFTISVGVSFNKTFAKLGSDYKKPDATTEITRDNYREILWPLPAKDMLFVGASGAETLKKHGISTIGDIALAGSAHLSELLGTNGESLWRAASGLDDSPVLRLGEGGAPKSVGNSITFRRDLCGMRDIRTGLILLSDQVGTRLRAQGMYCSLVQVQIKDPNLKVISRQKKLPAPTNRTADILEAAEELLKNNWSERSPIRLLSVMAGGLTDERILQLGLFDQPERDEKHEKIDAALDAVRQRFGKEALQFASVLNTDIVKKPDKDGIPE